MKHDPDCNTVDCGGRCVQSHEQEDACTCANRPRFGSPTGGKGIVEWTCKLHGPIPDRLWQRRSWRFCYVCRRTFRTDLGFQLHCNFARCSDA